MFLRTSQIKHIMYFGQACHLCPSILSLSQSLFFHLSQVQPEISDTYRLPLAIIFLKDPKWQMSMTSMCSSIFPRFLYIERGGQ